MGIREAINEKPLPTLIVTVIVIAAALGLMFMPRGNGPKFPGKSYYSDDDGKTWYIDDAKNVPPYDHNGKQALRAYLYKCADGKPFVQRLEAFDDGTKAVIEEEIKHGVAPLEAQMRLTGVKVKKPGNENWFAIKSGNPDEMAAMQSMQTPRCPDGSGGTPKRVTVEENAQP